MSKMVCSSEGLEGLDATIILGGAQAEALKRGVGAEPSVEADRNRF